MSNSTNKDQLVAEKISYYSNHPEVQEYFKLHTLPAEIRQDRIEAWNQYYKRVWSESKAAKNFRLQYDAFKNNNMKDVRERAEKARKALGQEWEEDLGEPSYPDPIMIEKSWHVQMYIHYKGLQNKSANVPRVKLGEFL